MFQKPSAKSCAKHSFTIIEILITVSIIALIVGVSMTALNSFNRSQQVEQAARDLETIIKEAQTRTLSSVEGRNWGVHLVNGSNTAEVFSVSHPSNSYNARSTTIPQKIAEGISVSNLRLETGNPGITQINIVFSVEDGSVVFVTDTGSCQGGSDDSGCASSLNECLSIQLTYQGESRYVKIYERTIFYSETGPAPCSL